MRDDGGLEQSVSRMCDEMCHGLSIFFFKAKVTAYASGSDVDCESREKPRMT